MVGAYTIRSSGNEIEKRRSVLVAAGGRGASRTITDGARFPESQKGNSCWVGRSCRETVRFVVVATRSNSDCATGNREQYARMYGDCRYRGIWYRAARAYTRRHDKARGCSN